MMSQSPQNLLVRGKNAFLSLSHAEKLSALLYFLLLLLLPTQLGKHFWPNYSLISGFRVDYLSPTLYVTDILVILLFLVQLQVTVKQRRIAISTPFLLALMYFGLTLIPAVTPLAGIVMLIKITEMLFFAWFTAAHVAKPLYVLVMPYLVLLTVLLQGALAILQLLSKGYTGGLLYYFGERAITSGTPGAATAVINGEIFLRSYGTFSHPNVLAGFLVIMMTYLLLNRETFTTRFGKTILLGGMLIGSIGLLTTLSRVPIMLFLIIVFLWGIAVLRNRLRRNLPYRYVVGGGAILILFFALLPLTSHVFLRFQESRLLEESLVVRSDLNAYAIDIIMKQPLMGVGLGNALFTLVTYKAAEDPLYLAVQPVHNILLFITAETGILGLCIFLLLLLLAWRRATSRGKVLLGIVLVLGMVDHYFLTIQQGQLLIALVLGYCFASFQKTQDNSSTRL